MRLENLSQVDGSFFWEALGVQLYFKWEAMGNVIYVNQTQSFPSCYPSLIFYLGRKICFLKNERLSLKNCIDLSL